jgi:hypothetical protein
MVCSIEASVLIGHESCASHKGAQCNARTAQPHARRADSYSEQGCDLLVAVAFHIVQHDVPAQPCVDGRKRGIEIQPKMRVHLSPHRQLRREVRVALLAAPFALGTADEDVHRQPMKPRADKSVATKRSELSLRTNEDVLCRLVRQLATDETPGEHMDTFRVGAIKPPECIHVATRGGSNVLRFPSLRGDVRAHG